MCPPLRFVQPRLSDERCLTQCSQPVHQIGSSSRAYGQTQRSGGVTVTPGESTEWREHGTILSCGTNNAVGVTTFLLGEVLKTRDELEAFRTGLRGFEIVVCRLRASISPMQQRIRVREPGMLQQSFIDRVAELD